MGEAVEESSSRAGLFRPCLLLVAVAFLIALSRCRARGSCSSMSVSTVREDGLDDVDNGACAS